MFSSARFDAALDLSPHINAMFDRNRNVGHKRAGTSNFYLRGSHSKSGLKSLPVSLLMCDEFDAMMQENVALAEERMSGQVEKQSWYFSTPSIPGFGINKKFEESSQEHFHIPCPCCGKWIFLELEDFVLNEDKLTDSYTACPKCKKALPSNKPNEVAAKLEMISKGRSVKHNSSHDEDTRGFRVNQLYSCTVSPAEIARAIILARDDAYYRQELHNSKMGQPFINVDARVTLEMIQRNTPGFKTVDAVTPDGKVRTLGVDVGGHNHWSVLEWSLGEIGPDVTTNAKARLIAFGKYREFEDLDPLFSRYQIHSCVIDANPERRKATEFAARHPGFVKLCCYGNGSTGRSITIHDGEGSAIGAEHMITVDRSSFCEAFLGRLISSTERLNLPVDLSEEYRKHLLNVVKVYQRDKNGNPVARFICASDSVNDHY